MRLVLTVVFLSMASVLHAETPPTPISADLDPCWAFTKDATYVKHTLYMQLEDRDVQMRVPVDYFEDPWDRRDGSSDTAQLFRVEIRSFLPVTRPETAERQKQGFRSVLLILIGDQLPVDALAPREAERYVRGGNPDRPLTDYPRLPGPFGLNEIASSSKHSQREIQRTIYLSEDSSGAPSAIMNCQMPDAVPNPQCRHFFSAAGVDVSLSYDLSELANWKIIQNNVARFLMCATSSNL